MGCEHKLKPGVKLTVLAPTRMFIPEAMEFRELDIGDEVKVLVVHGDGLILVEHHTDKTEFLLHKNLLDLSPLEALAKAADEPKE